MANFQTDEEMDRRCQEMLAAARAANPNLTAEEEGDLIGDLYIDAMCEFFPSDAAMLEFFQEHLQIPPDTE